ncbi:MAG: DUF3536 domain-containing protein [Synergistaceae bacterium]|nr:DUF3536 domain-containing protein [Synergistaceae bacterium]
MSKYITIHGHFYQPPRENPWYGEIELQDSAAPWHDWNERINSECYLRNTAARILDNQGKITKICNNYSGISFNFGPTLLSWAEKKAPLMLKSLIEADKVSQARFSGHGAAIAQVYNHMIMPLANLRDKITQVRWGMADFETRFGRHPEGMWLAEAAVDTETLEILRDNGIVFTILSPYQAQSVRKMGSDSWTDVSGGRVDTTFPYRFPLPSGRFIDIFFYNGEISQEIAFKGLLNSGEDYAHWLINSIPDEFEDRLANAATDGESYGHHHRHGDMALAYCIETINRDPEVILTVYGEFLRKHPPQHIVQIIENSSWSCAHGVERWRSDCGCNTGRGFHQKWREPLRDALDWLRDSIKDEYEREIEKILDDAWGARDAYIQIILDHSPEKVSEWLYSNSGVELNIHESARAIRLLEMQRNALLMYTSCGWFFDDIAGIETVQILCYASRVIDFAKELLGKDLEEEFKNKIELALGNTDEFPNGKAVYEKLVEPMRITPERKVAQAAIYSLILESPLPDVTIDIRRQGDSRYCVGHAAEDATLSFGGRPFFFAAMLNKDHDLICGVKELPYDSEVSTKIEYEKLCGKFSSAEVFGNDNFMKNIFGENIYNMNHLIRDMRQFLLTCLIEKETYAIEDGVRGMVDKYEGMLSLVGKSEVALPSVVQSVAGIVLNADIERAFSSEEMDFARILASIDKAHDWGVQLNMNRINYAASSWLIAKMYELEGNFPGAAVMDEIIRMLELVLTKLQWDLSLSETQNTYYRIFCDKKLNADWKEQLGEDAYNKFFKIGMLLRFSEKIFQG